jgi:hypothetical protein
MFSRLVQQARRIVYGQAPDVRPWHPNWPEFRLPVGALRRVARAGGELLIVSDSPGGYSDWLRRAGNAGRLLEQNRILSMPAADLAACAGRFSGCLLVMAEGHIRIADKLIKRISSLLRPSGSLFILVTNDRQSDAPAFALNFAQHAVRFLDLSTWVTDIIYVRSGAIRWGLRRRLALLGRRATSLRPYQVPYFVIESGLVSALNGLLNLMAWRAAPYPPRRGLCSSIFIELRPGMDQSSAASPVAQSQAHAPDSGQEGTECSAPATASSSRYC